MHDANKPGSTLGRSPWRKRTLREMACPSDRHDDGIEYIT